MQRVGGIGIADLRLDHHQGNAVHKEDDVRDDAALHAPRRINAELVDGVEDIALRVGKVDQLYYRVSLPGEFIHIDLRFEEKRLHRLVGFQQCAAGLAYDLVAQIIELAVSQPGSNIGGEIERADRRA